VQTFEKRNQGSSTNDVVVFFSKSNVLNFGKSNIVKPLARIVDSALNKMEAKN
jgi:hypothetical protein